VIPNGADVVMEHLLDELPALAKSYEDELVAMRRDLHAHPEVGRTEIRTTRVVRERLLAAGLDPRDLSIPTGLVCDVGTGDRAVALRTDLDALPVVDDKDVPYHSTVIGVCHACGHDVHTAIVLGAGLVLSDLHREGLLPGRVRLIFQPAEEIMPGGALDVIAAGGLTGVDRIFGIHCDPRLDTGLVGLMTGPITSAADHVRVRLRGRGGHTARPHLTADLVYALAKVAVEVPAALSRRVDPRAGMSLVWGRIAAGAAANAIPSAGEVEGTLRCLSPEAWHQAPETVEELVSAVAMSYGVQAQIDYQRGVPPVVNEASSVGLFESAALATLGADSVTTTDQSLGGEDFAWYLEHIPGAMVRLGVRRPGDDLKRDLHQGSFDADERAIALGVRLLTASALLALGEVRASGR
jgi:amidohydrolase